MDRFPDDFNTKNLKKFRESNQKTLLCGIRKNFHEIVIKDSRAGLQSNRLKFPKNLNRIYRIKICEELLLKFDEITVTFNIKDPRICGNYPLEKIFRGYPDDEFLSEYMSENKNKSINIEIVTICY
jgi:hypothetical protein